MARSLETYKRDRAGRLNSWGWVDRKQGLVRMPIETAMEKVVSEAQKK